LIEKIKWQFWRPVLDPQGRLLFWNLQYNTATWSLLIFFVLCALFPAENDIKKRPWSTRVFEFFKETFMEPIEGGDDDGLPNIPVEQIKTKEENTARIRRAKEARERAKLAEDTNRPKSIAEQLADLEVDVK